MGSSNSSYKNTVLARQGYGKQNFRVSRPLFEDPDASESDGDEDEEENGGSMRESVAGRLTGAPHRPTIRSYEYFKAVSARKVEKGPKYKRSKQSKGKVTQADPSSRNKFLEPHEWQEAEEDDVETPNGDVTKSLNGDVMRPLNGDVMKTPNGDVMKPKFSKSPDTDTELRTPSSSSSLPALSPESRLQPVPCSDGKVDQCNQTDFPDSPSLLPRRFGSKNRGLRKNKKDRLKLPSIGTSQKDKTKTSQGSKSVCYLARGDTSRMQKSKSRSLRELTAAFRENVSNSDSDKDDQRWLEKMNQPIDVIDQDSYDLFARRRKLAKPYVPRPAIPKHEKMESMEASEVFIDDCEEDTEFKVEPEYSEEFIDHEIIDNEVFENGTVSNGDREQRNSRDLKSSTTETLPSLHLERERCLVSIELSSAGQRTANSSVLSNRRETVSLTT